MTRLKIKIDMYNTKCKDIKYKIQIVNNFSTIHFKKQNNRIYKRDEK